MNVRWLDFGKISYYFTMSCPGDNNFKEAKVADVVPVLIPAFNLADKINTVTKIVVC